MPRAPPTPMHVQPGGGGSGVGVRDRGQIREAPSVNGGAWAERQWLMWRFRWPPRKRGLAGLPKTGPRPLNSPPASGQAARDLLQAPRPVASPTKNPRRGGSMRVAQGLMGCCVLLLCVVIRTTPPFRNLTVRTCYVPGDCLRILPCVVRDICATSNKQRLVGPDIADSGHPASARPPRTLQAEWRSAQWLARFSLANCFNDSESLSARCRRSRALPTNAHQSSIKSAQAKVIGR